MNKLCGIYNYYFDLHVDIPECEEGLVSCADNATCSNTIGSYECFCDEGFSGDGFINCNGTNYRMLLSNLNIK